MRTSSKKAKGRSLQNFVVKELREFMIKEGCNPEAVVHWVKPAIMGESGQDVKLTYEGAQWFPYSVECKNQETWSIPAWWKQTTANTEEGRKPLLVIKKNRHEPLVVMRWEDFKELL